jgi:hypothetical protein
MADTLAKYFEGLCQLYGMRNPLSFWFLDAGPSQSSHLLLSSPRSRKTGGLHGGLFPAASSSPPSLRSQSLGVPGRCWETLETLFGNIAFHANVDNTGLILYDAIGFLFGLEAMIFPSSFPWTFKNNISYYDIPSQPSKSDSILVTIS